MLLYINRIAQNIIMITRINKILSLVHKGLIILSLFFIYHDRDQKPFIWISTFFGNIYIP